MCKILVIPSIKADKKIQTSVRRFMLTVAPLLSKHNDDGFGVMSYGENGLFTEKWLKNTDAFQNRPSVDAEIQNVVKQYMGAVIAPQNYVSTGERSSTLKAVALHARKSTNTVNIQNTHPFVEGNTALIHNGIVDKTGLTFKTSSCDSEGILNEYIASNVAGNIKNIDEVAYALNGYFACAVFSEQNDRPILDVFRDNTASLFAAYIREIDATVFCTSCEDIKTACQTLKWRKPTILDVAENVVFRTDVLSGEVIAVYEFENESVAVNYDDLDAINMADFRAAIARGSTFPPDEVKPVDVAFHASGEGYRSHNDDDGWNSSGYGG